MEGASLQQPKRAGLAASHRDHVLAVANEMGMDAIGVELSRKRCATALTLRLLKSGDDSMA